MHGPRSDSGRDRLQALPVPRMPAVRTAFLAAKHRHEARRRAASTVALERH